MVDREPNIDSPLGTGGNDPLMDPEERQPRADEQKGDALREPQNPNDESPTAIDPEADDPREAAAARPKDDM